MSNAKGDRFKPVQINHLPLQLKFHEVMREVLNAFFSRPVNAEFVIVQAKVFTGDEIGEGSMLCCQERLLKCG